MVNGIEKFKDFFSEYKEQYVLIGGTACDIVMEESAGEFRATKDLDIVLIVEALTPEFGKAFWQFVNEGNYRNKCKSNGQPQFYRFDKPEKVGYPYMLELFSKGTFELEDSDSELIPLHIGDEISSLSAILLNDDYYKMLLKGRAEIEGLTILSPTYIIPFKAKAWLDLTLQKESGIKVDSKNIKKHKNDIVRLATILTENRKVELPDEVYKDMDKFIKEYENNPADLNSLKIKGITNNDIIEILKAIYL